MSVPTEDLVVTSGTGRLPQVNLLPPEIGEARRFRRVQVALAAAVLGAVATVGLLYVGAHRSATDAETQVAASQAEQSRLQQEADTYRDMTATYDRAATAKAVLAQAMGAEVRYSRLLNDLSLAAPADLWLTDVTYSQAATAGTDTGSTAGGAGTSTAPSAAGTGTSAAPSTAGTGTSAAPSTAGTGTSAAPPTAGTDTSTAPTTAGAPVPAAEVDSPIGTVTMSGVAFTHDAVAAWLDTLAQRRGYTSVSLQSSTGALLGTRKVINWTLSARTTADALSGRYTGGG